MIKQPVADAGEQQYALASVEEIEAPEGCEEKGAGRWFRYVIERGTSTIVGQRRGTRQQVATYAKEYVAELNARSGGRASSPWAPRQKK